MGCAKPASNDLVMKEKLRGIKIVGLNLYRKKLSNKYKKKLKFVTKLHRFGVHIPAT